MQKSKASLGDQGKLSAELTEGIRTLRVCRALPCGAAKRTPSHPFRHGFAVPPPLGHQGEALVRAFPHWCIPNCNCVLRGRGRTPPLRYDEFFGVQKWAGDPPCPCFYSALRFSRNLLKNARSMAEHSSSSTPGTSSGFWLHGSMNRSTAEPQQPLVGSFAP